MKASEINTIQDVIKFAQWNHDNKVIVHPDSDYLDFVTNAGKNTFTKAQAKELNETMAKCHQVCKDINTDIYFIFVHIPSLQERRFEVDGQDGMIMSGIQLATDNDVFDGYMLPFITYLIESQKGDTFQFDQNGPIFKRVK